jgi:hypothetical protein
LRKAKHRTVSSSSPSRSPKETSTTVASGSDRLSMLTTGVGTADGAVARGSSEAARALRLWLAGASERAASAGEVREAR